MTPTQRACTQLDALRYRALGGNETACAQVVQAFAGPDLFDAIVPLLRRVEEQRTVLRVTLDYLTANPVSESEAEIVAGVESVLAALDVEIARGTYAFAKAGGVL